MRIIQGNFHMNPDDAKRLTTPLDDGAGKEKANPFSLDWASSYS